MQFRGKDVHGANGGAAQGTGQSTPVKLMIQQFAFGRATWVCGHAVTGVPDIGGDPSFDVFATARVLRPAGAADARGEAG